MRTVILSLLACQMLRLSCACYPARLQQLQSHTAAGKSRVATPHVSRALQQQWMSGRVNYYKDLFVFGMPTAFWYGVLQCACSPTKPQLISPMQQQVRTVIAPKSLSGSGSDGITKERCNKDPCCHGAHICPCLTVLLMSSERAVLLSIQARRYLDRLSPHFASLFKWKMDLSEFDLHQLKSCVSTVWHVSAALVLYLCLGDLVHLSLPCAFCRQR